MGREARSGVVVLVMVAGVVGAAGWGAGGAVSAPAAVPVIDFATNGAANFDASQLGQQLMGELAGVAGYAGLQIVAGGVEVDTAGAPSRAVLSLIAGAARTIAGVTVPVVMRQVSYSLADLDQLAGQIGGDQAMWAERGVTLTSWGPDVVSNSVRVMLAHYSSDNRDAVLAYYGDRVSVEARDVTASASSDRTFDASPWWGGDYITIGTARQQCTSWFSLHSTGNNVDYNATAGHCTPQGGAVYNSSAEAPPAASKQGSITLNHVNWDNGGTVDVAIYSVASNQARVWADPTTQSRLVTARATQDPTGTLLCTDGQYDREVCSVKIVQSDVTASYNGKDIVHQVYCQQIYDQPAFSGGDSGAPVYAGRNGAAEAQAFGMLIARQTADPAYGYYTPVRSIFAAFTDLTFKPAS